MGLKGRPWSAEARGRAARRRELGKLYPDDRLGEEHDDMDDPRAPLGFCPFCGLRRPCHSCMDVVAAQSLAAKDERNCAVGPINRKG